MASKQKALLTIPDEPTSWSGGLQEASERLERCVIAVDELQEPLVMGGKLRGAVKEHEDRAFSKKVLAQPGLEQVDAVCEAVGRDEPQR